MSANKHYCPNCHNELSPPHQDGPEKVCWCDHCEFGCDHCENIWTLDSIERYEKEQERIKFLEEKNKQLKDKLSKIPKKEQFLKDLNDYVSEKIDVLINSFKLKDEYIDSSRSILEHTFVRNTLMEIFDILEEK